MPNLTNTKIDIESFVASNITTIPLSYDNIQYNGDKDYYAHVTVAFIDSENANIGSQVHKRVRHEGVIIFKVYTEIGIGTNKSLEALDYIKTQVENKYISSNLFTYAAESIRKGEDDVGNYVGFLRIPFVSDE